MPARQGLGPEVRRVHPQGLQLLECLEPDRLVRVPEGLNQYGAGRLHVGLVLLRQRQHAAHGRLPDADHREPVPPLAPCSRIRPT